MQKGGGGVRQCHDRWDELVPSSSSPTSSLLEHPSCWDVFPRTVSVCSCSLLSSRELLLLFARSLRQRRTPSGQAETSATDRVLLKDAALHVGCLGAALQMSVIQRHRRPSEEQTETLFQPGFVSLCRVGAACASVKRNRHFQMICRAYVSVLKRTWDLTPSLKKPVVSFWTGYASSRSLRSPGLTGLDVEASR